MVRTSRSQTDVATVVPSPAAVASSASSSSASSSPSGFGFHTHGSDHDLRKLSSGANGVHADQPIDFADVDVAAVFARVVAAEDAKKGILLDGFDVEMRDFDLDDGQMYDGGGGMASFPEATATPSRPVAKASTTKQPRKKATAAKKSTKSGTIKQEASLTNSKSEVSAVDASAFFSQSPQQQQGDEALSTLELRRKRNRDSMRRARNRQRNEQEKLETMIDQLEDRLEAIMRSKENSLVAATSSSTSTNNEDEGSTTSYNYSAYSGLLRQTELLRDQNDELSEQIRKHAHFQDRIGKLADQDKKQLASEIEADAADEDHTLLQPLLQWVTRATVVELVHYSRDRLLEVAELTNTLVPTTHNVLGWEGKRTIHANWAHYTMTKGFLHESAEWLAKRTWDCTVNQDVGEMKQVLSWANGTKVLHRLSSDAVVIARDMLVPNLQDIDHPIRIRYILLVFRTPIPNGFLVGTETLNVYGTSVEDCLEQKVSLQKRMQALTMYAFLFTRICAPETGADLGCSVTLAGRSGDGSLMYAHKVLFEVLPSILRWENTFVAPILRVTD